MKFEIEYSQTIIVGVIYQGIWSWFVSEKETWLLDTNSKAPDCPEDPESFDLNSAEGIEKFLESVADEKVEKAELSDKLKEILPVTAWDELIEFCPSLYINFDKRFLKSLFPEYTRFEKYVPDGWAGNYEDFLSEIPYEERYWIIDSVDYFEPFLKG